MRSFGGVVLCAAIAALTAGCGRQPTIEFTEVPDAGIGGSETMQKIAGRAPGAKSNHRVVLFAKSGVWWVQPFSNRPITSVQGDSSWSTTTHLGSEYAAVLVDPSYIPPTTTDNLPELGGGVIAIAKKKGAEQPSFAPLASQTIRFSGYEWEVVQLASSSAGVPILNRASNVWTDTHGWLHLRIAQEAGQWTCAEIRLTRSLGYGAYSFRAREIGRLEPATVFGMFTWDPLEAGQNHREMDIELSQWGDPEIKNAQFTIQPYYVAANVFRFDAPNLPLTHTFHWEPGRVTFQTSQGTPSNANRKLAEHIFTSGIPTPGGETVHINLYIYGKTRTPQRNGSEVVIEKFEYLP